MPFESISTWRRCSFAMAHIAIQEKLNGKGVEWMEKVSDENNGA
jgi:hypothetical protein